MKKHHLYTVSLFLALAFIFSVRKETGSDADNKNKIQSPAPGIIQKQLKQTNTYSADVAFKWMDMQLQLMRTNPTAIGGPPAGRIFAYSGIALYESVRTGMPGYQTLTGQLTDMPAMPETEKKLTYHWPASANAAMAYMNRHFFSNTSNENKSAMDSLENALNKIYQAEIGMEEFQCSANFGKAVAHLIFEWSKSDGSANANAPYTPPSGPGLWAPTPPFFIPAFGPYWGKNRLFVSGSLDNTAPDTPPAYSTDPSSAYYKMAKEVYDISQTLTPEQKAIALYYRDNPGYGDGHYLSLLKQILEQEKSRLDFTAVAYAKAGIACVDACAASWKIKFQYNQDRPIRYIREVLGHREWNTLFDTPPFPDFPSGHSTITGSFGEILKGFFGNSYHFTNHTYHYLGMKPRSYNSFDDLAKEIGDSPCVCRYSLPLFL
jgi:hypothetical protein